MKEKRECEMCGRYEYLEKHHLIFGRGLRELADKYGLIINICRSCHRKIHKYKDLMKWSKEKGQKMFERKRSRKEFIDIFGKSYL